MGRPALLELFRRLRAFLTSAPAIPLGPELSAEIEHRFVAAVAVEAQAGNLPAGVWAMALDSLGFQLLGWRADPPPTYLAFLQTLVVKKPKLSRASVQDTLLTVLRHGARTPGGDLYTDKLVRVFGTDGIGLELQAALPNSRAVRFLQLMLADEEAGDDDADDPVRGRLIALAEEALYDPNLTDDLAAPYRLDGLVLLAEHLDDLGDDDKALEHDRGRKAEVGRRLETVCEEVLAIEETNLEFLGETYRMLAAGLRYQNRHGEVVARMEPGLKRMEDWIARLEERGLGGVALRGREDLLETLAVAARHAKGKRRWELVDRLLDQANRFGRSSSERLEALVVASEFHRKKKRYDQAEAVLEPYFDVGYRNPMFTREAVRISLAREDMEEARRRLRRGLRYRSDNEELQKLRRELFGRGD